MFQAREFFWRWGLTISIALGAVPILVTAIFGVMIFQMKHLPIVVNFVAEIEDRPTETSIVINGTMQKRFEITNNVPMCRYAGMQWYAETADGRDEPIDWRPSENRGNRQTGSQSFGPWTIDYSRAKNVTGVYAVVDHWCLLIWPTRTILGPIQLASADAPYD